MMFGAPEPLRDPNLNLKMELLEAMKIVVEKREVTLAFTKYGFVAKQVGPTGLQIDERVDCFDFRHGWGDA